MRLAGYQPQFFPRLHYINRVLDSDIFEVSDYVQFVKKHAFPMPDGSMKRGVSYQAHTPIKLSNGEFMLVVPTGDDILPINKIKIVYNHNWQEKMLKSLEIAYRKSPNFNKFFPELDEIINENYDNLASFTMKTTLWGVARSVTDEKIDFKTFDCRSVEDLLQAADSPFRLKTVFLASESPVKAPEKGKTNEWLVELCRYANANEYFYGGTSHSAYMDLEKLEKAGIKSVLQNWKCKEYPQQYMKAGFISNLSIIDLVMNCDLYLRQKILS